MTSQTSSARRLSPQPAPASPPSQPRAKRLTLGAQPSSAQAAVVLRTAADAAGLSEVAFGDAAGVSPTTARAALTEGACPFARVLAVAATCPHFARSLAERDFRHCEAAAWRKRLAGKANASDTEVKAALLRIVRVGQLASLPKTNAHVRDAIGVALWGWWQK